MVYKIKVGDTIRFDGMYGVWRFDGIGGKTILEGHPTRFDAFMIEADTPDILTDRDGKHWQDAGPAQGGDGTWRVVRPAPVNPLDTLRAARDEWQRDGDISILSDAVNAYLKAVK